MKVDWREAVIIVAIPWDQWMGLQIRTASLQSAAQCCGSLLITAWLECGSVEFTQYLGMHS